MVHYLTDTIEGTIAPDWWFHYDLANDVLYLRRAEHRETPSHGEETPDGLIILRAMDDDSPIGLTVVNWWSRFGEGQLPDSIRAIEEKIRLLPRRIAA